jgi:hypothetical protein
MATFRLRQGASGWFVVSSTGEEWGVFETELDARQFRTSLEIKQGRQRKKERKDD